VSTWRRLKATVTGIEHQLNMWTPTIQCDECGTQYRAHGLFPFGSLRDPARTDQVIRENVWTIDGNRHICPECQPPAGLGGDEGESKP
jgi:hypothetical protein